MSHAFEMSEYDVENVLELHQVKYTEKSLEQMMSIIDENEVTEAALSAIFDENDADDAILEKQTETAYEEIAWQLFKAGFIKKRQIEKFGNKELLNRENKQDVDQCPF